MPQAEQRQGVENAAAFHWAGHAVALLANGLGFHRMVIGPGCGLRQDDGRLPQGPVRNVVLAAGAAAEVLAARGSILPDAAVAGQVVRQLSGRHGCQSGQAPVPGLDEVATALAIVSTGWQDVARLASAQAGSITPLAYSDVLALMENRHGTDIGRSYDLWRNACAGPFPH